MDDERARLRSLIAPGISTLSALLKVGELTPEERAKPYPVKLSTIPDALLRFIESPSLERLALVAAWIRSWKEEQATSNRRKG